MYVCMYVCMSAAETVQVSHALPAVRSLVVTAGLRDQFPRWRLSRKRLSVYSVLGCPDLRLQCSVSFVQGLEMTHHACKLEFHNYNTASVNNFHLPNNNLTKYQKVSLCRN